MAELRTLTKENDKIRILAISVDPPERSKALAQKIASDGKGPITFTLLSDPDHKVIDSYRLHDPAYDGEKVEGIPYPAVYVIDKEGRVAWAKVESNYRKRPSIAEIRAAVNALP